MKGTAKVKSPEGVEVTMTFTMTIAKWTALAEQIGTKWPGMEFSGMINRMVREMQTVIYEDKDLK